VTLTLPHVDRLTAIADAYAAAPVYDPSAVRYWRDLAADSVDRAAYLRRRFAVVETADPEPYPDAPAMCEDINAGRFTVSTAHCDHPVWTVAENVAFRIVHDIDGHWTTGGDFGWTGENLACGAHAADLARRGHWAARQALFTECIAQTAYANAFGHFGEQKVVLL
jgi:hypothetical protein